MATYGTTVAQEYSAKVLKVFFATSFFDDITNKDYFTPGDANPKTTKSIKSRYQKYNIPTLYTNGWSAYTGTDISYSTIVESVATLTIDQFKALADSIPDLNVFYSQVKDPNSTIIQQAGSELKKLMDAFITGSTFVGDAGSGNIVATEYSTGTVAVDVSGNVTGNGTTFTSAMAGKGFKALGHTKWYRVKTFTNATSIVIEDDEDDTTTHYSGGVLTAGKSYVVKGSALLAVTDANIAKYLSKASGALTDSEVPEEGRWIVLPAAAKAPLLSCATFNKDIERVYDDTVRKGKVARAYGFDIYIAPDNRVYGNNSTGFYCLFGHKSAITAGYGFIDPIKLVDPESNFGTKIKGLFAYGAKVADERRKALGYLWATFNLS